MKTDSQLIALLLAALVLSACDSNSGPGGGGGGATGKNLFLTAMPPGANGNSAGGIGAPVPGAPVVRYPPHFKDTLALYGDLSFAQPGLKPDPCTPPKNESEHAAASDQACNYFKNEALTPDQTESTATMNAADGKQVTIARDGWGVPFIEGEDRQAAMFGLGFAQAQDRLWLMDALRNIGRGRFSQFLGPFAATFGFDKDLAAVAGYSEDELTAMADFSKKSFGPVGDLLLADVDSYVAGINAYIATLSGSNSQQVPPEYAAFKGGGFPPPPFTRNDVVAAALLIQSIFATGGGGEHINELMLQKLDPSFKPDSTAVPDAACKLWRDLRHANDPDATRTIDTAFATQSPGSVSETCPQPLPAGAAIWDPDSFQTRVIFTVNGSSPLGAQLPLPFGQPLLNLPSLAPQPAVSVTVPLRPKKQAPRVLRASLDPIEGARLALAAAGIRIPRTMSNFIGVTGAHTDNGHPITVMGPQTGYFVPQLLWEAAIVSKGGTPQNFAGRGVMFVDTPYIELGRGIDFAWSATSGESDLIDVRVSKMCNLDPMAPPPSRDDADGDGFPDADGYLFDAGDGQGEQCRQFYRRVDTWTANPTPASLASGGSQSPQTVKRFILRTHYGPVFATALVNGEPVAISQQRSTFFDELGTAVPFSLASTAVIRDPQSFQQVFNGVTGTFNWLYVDKNHLGYIHSGLYPVRDPGQHPELPVWGDGRFEWASMKTLPAGFFDNFGGDGNNGAVSFPSLNRPAAQGDPLNGFFQWQGFLQLADHPQTVDPAKGFIASWNNSPAKDWWAADNMGSWGPVHRVDMLARRLEALLATDRKINFANMVEVMADAAYTDLRGQEILPLLLETMKTGTLTDPQSQLADLMQQWTDGASSEAWIGPTAKGLGAWRRDRDNSGTYDFRSQVVLMDAWYPHLVKNLLPQITAIDDCDPATGGGGNGFALQNCYDAPRAQGSAYQSGWFQHLKRILQMALNTPGHTDYRSLKCAGTGDPAGCRQAVLDALDQAVADLGGFDNRANWDGTQLRSAKFGNDDDPDNDTGNTVEDYDAVEHTSLSLLPVDPIPWLNRPTFQQVVQITEDRTAAP